MFIDTLSQGKNARTGNDWGWFEQDIKSHYRLDVNSRFMDTSSGSRSARPVFDGQPAVYGR